MGAEHMTAGWLNTAFDLIRLFFFLKEINDDIGTLLAEFKGNGATDSAASASYNRRLPSNLFVFISLIITSKLN